MPMGAYPVPHRVHWLHRWFTWVIVGLLAAVGYQRRHRPSVPFGPGAVLVAARAVRGAGDRRPLRHLLRPGEPHETERTHDRAQRRRPPCVLEAGPKRRGHLSRWRAGGRGDRARGRRGAEQLSALNLHRDILLVDQRGTGRSKPHHLDATQYGTRMAMDDLDAVRAALGYRQLDVIGSSYGATAAQVYARLHPSSVRTLVLVAGGLRSTSRSSTFTPSTPSAPSTSSPRPCASQPECRAAFPGWERQFGELVQAWNAHPVHGTKWRRVRLGRPRDVAALGQRGLDPAGCQPAP